MKRFQKHCFLFLLLFTVCGLGVNRCTSGADPEILPVEESYKPDQPIEFPHDIHAGKLEIDCKYCHNASVDGKKEGIPAANVCMNCHKQVTGNSTEKKEN